MYQLSTHYDTWWAYIQSSAESIPHNRFRYTAQMTVSNMIGLDKPAQQWVSHSIGLDKPAQVWQTSLHNRDKVQQNSPRIHLPRGTLISAGPCLREKATMQFLRLSFWWVDALAAVLCTMELPHCSHCILVLMEQDSVQCWVHYSSHNAS